MFMVDHYHNIVIVIIGQGREDMGWFLLLLLLLVETKTAAQHSCHMLQVRDFKGALLGIGSKVWRDVSS